MTVDQQSPHAVSLTKPSDLEFRVERTFDHPIERVWAAYTDPTLIPQWWGQGTTVDRLDLRTGGGWRFVSNPGSDKESASSGDFLEVSPPNRLVQTFGRTGSASPTPRPSSWSGSATGRASRSRPGSTLSTSGTASSPTALRKGPWPAGRASTSS